MQGCKCLKYPYNNFVFEIWIVGQLWVNDVWGRNDGSRNRNAFSLPRRDPDKHWRGALNYVRGTKALRVVENNVEEIQVWQSWGEVMGEWKQWENTHLEEHEKDAPYLSVTCVCCLGSVYEIRAVLDASPMHVSRTAERGARHFDGAYVVGILWSYIGECLKIEFH